MIVVDEMLAEMDALDPDREKCEWDREFLREVGYLPDFSPFVRIEGRRAYQDRVYTPPEWITAGQLAMKEVFDREQDRLAAEIRNLPATWMAALRS